MDELSISFSVPPQCVLYDNPSRENGLSYPGGQWLPGAFINPARNCLSVNDKRTLDDTVVIWHDEGDGGMPINRMTLEELRREVWYATFYLTTVV